MDLALLTARLVLAAVFTLAAITKLLDRTGSRQAVADFGVPQALADPVSLALPYAELAIVIALIPAAWAWWGALGALLLLTIFIVGMGFNLAQGNTPDCHCFGQLYSQPIGVQTIVRNAVLGLVAVFVLVAGFRHPGPNAISWVQNLTGNERLALALGVLGLLAAAAQWWLLLHPPFWLADRLSILGGTSLVERPARRSNLTPIADDVSVQPGLPVGSMAPRFRLPGLRGETMTLDSLRAGGRAVILIFVSPSCGPCSALMPDLARWQIDYAGNLRFVLISSGTLEDNRVKAEEHGIIELLLQKTFEVGSVYGVSGTPGAVIVYPDGKIGSPVASGADQIRGLLDQYIELLAAEAGVELEDEGELARAMHAAANPLEIGAPAPDLELVDTTGRTIRLAEAREHDTALLFWSTTCGYCQRLEPALRAWEADQPVDAPELLVVLDAPLTNDQSINLRSRVLIDPDLALSAALYSSGTPTAVLIDAQGNIASQPAVGADAIRPLLGIGPTEPVSPPIQLQSKVPPRPFIAPPAAGNKLLLGSPVPDVVLTSLRGQQVHLSELHGQNILLLFWDSDDVTCRQIEPQVQAWETGLRPGMPELVVVVTGSSGGRQVINVGSQVLIDRDGAAARSFGAQSTPVAVLIDAEGKMAVEPALGAAPILRLLAWISPVSPAPREESVTGAASR